MLRLCSKIAACSLVLVSFGFAQTTGAPPGPLPSPAATASVAIGGGTITVDYHAPHMRGRAIMGTLVPYGQVWRTGANEATVLTTTVPLHIGNLLVPAGKYTLYTLPTAKSWLLIVNKQTGQWGTEYTPAMDLGRVPMKDKSIAIPQEIMSISFEDTKGAQTDLHVRWEKTDVSVRISTP